MPFSKFIYLVFSVCFLFVLAEPTLVLLTSGHEGFSITSSMEKEAENKDLEDTREFSELDFDKNNLLEVCFFIALSSFILHSSFVLFGCTIFMFEECSKVSSNIRQPLPTSLQ